MATHLNRGSDELEDVHGIDATPPIDIITTSMLLFRVKGGSNLNSGFALSCGWFGHHSLRKKLIACRRKTA